MPSVIELKNVTVGFGEENILERVNLDLLQGETLVIIGPSGSGKTVLLKTMAGVYEPKEGQVLCEGQEWKNLASEKRREMAQHIGVQFQKNALFDSISTFDNVAFPLREYEVLSEEEIQTRVQKCLEDVNLWKSRDMLPHELSGGMRQRVAIARAMATNPSIIFFDDPTAGLDPINAEKMADLMNELKIKNNATMVVVTHDMNVAFYLAGRIVLVVDREVIETGNAEETKKHSDPRVQQFIHGRLKGPIQMS